MNRDDILLFLKAHKEEMHRIYGVKHVGLFGSYARRTERDDSDIDIVVEFESSNKTLRNFMGFKRYLEGNLGKPVDLGIESTLKPVVRQSMQSEIIYA